MFYNKHDFIINNLIWGKLAIWRSLWIRSYTMGQADTRSDRAVYFNSI